ncbi:MAG: hypothetical protein H6Q10_1109 [Acidobacteria bacterium]|nr:hypothetical protein [Acidobacteriota bacterium]
MQSTILAAGRAARRFAAVLAPAALLAYAPSASAQLDQLQSLKRVTPNVIVIVDTSFTMLEDGSGNYYDPNTYRVADNPELAAALGVSGDGTYRRIYANLRFSSTQDASTKYEADNVYGIGYGGYWYDNFWRQTRYDIALRGLARAVQLNKGTRFRWGLMRLPQTGAAWRTSATGCDKPVVITQNPAIAELSDNFTGCSAGANKLGIYAPLVTGPNGDAASASASVTPVAYNTASTVYARVAHFLPDEGPDLIPAGADTALAEDRPLTKALTEAKARVVAAIQADTVPQACPTCRNTVIVLLAGGSDSSADAAAKATEFLSVSAGGLTRRVPIYVVGIKPKYEDVAQLRAIATNSGGLYFTARNQYAVTHAVNLALQAGFGRFAEVNLGRASEYTAASPVVGTVNLENATDSHGLPLSNTLISTSAGTGIPQRNNIMITPGFALGTAAQALNPSGPGFDGRLRAFRVYKPIEDSTKPSGYTFTKDGTPLWPDRDGRPELAGMARVPADPGLRNIYTHVPGHGTVAFTTDNGELLRSYLGGVDPATVINYVRSLPLGAIIGSTPAVMDPPSIEPPPDSAYGKPEGSGTYAADHKDRRSIIWVGANDGMLHAIDARTGYEVWAFIPFNLLPKLWTLMEGQPVEQFSYFVDHSAKIAEVKMNGEWRTYLVIGEGPGGTFYQAFDVTEAGMDGPLPNSDDHQGVLQTFADPNRVQFKWAFPSYSSFEPTIRADVTVTDATPGSVVRFYGDLKLSATAAEKTVGFTWSDPAVGPLDLNRTVNVAIVGSGYFPAEAEALTSPLAARRQAGVGRSFYLIQLSDGRLLGNLGGSSCTGTGCLDVGEVNNNSRKNALQADPTVTGDPGAYVAKRAYMGDIDGNYWRFNFTSAGAITKTLMKDTGQPIYASSALMTLGTLQQYIYFATGSDLLPTTPASAGGTGTFKLYGLTDIGASAATAWSVALAPVIDSAGVAVGERPSASPSVAGDIVFFTTNVETVTPTACADATFNLWALTYQGGSAYGTATSTGGKKNTTPPPTPAMSGFGRATAPFVVDQHLYFGTSGAGGASIEAFGDPNGFNNGVGQVGVRILSWREIRQ